MDGETVVGDEREGGKEACSPLGTATSTSQERLWRGVSQAGVFSLRAVQSLRAVTEASASSFNGQSGLETPRGYLSLFIVCCVPPPAAVTEIPTDFLGV